MLVHFPRITTDGLVLCLDAGNPLSYPGTGYIWTDLSGNTNNGSFGGLGGDPTYNSANKGSLSFDGVNDYITSNENLIFSGNQALTLSAWFKTNVLTLDGAFYRRILAFNNNYGILISTTSVGWYTAGANLVTSANISTGLWYKVDCLYTGSVYETYLNGSLSDSYTASFPSTNSQLWLGRYHASSNGKFNGNIAQVFVYNRALSSSEIQDNYLATKGRYGL